MNRYCHLLAFTVAVFAMALANPVVSQTVPTKAGDRIRIHTTQFSNPSLIVRVQAVRPDSIQVAPEIIATALWLQTKSITRIEKQFPHPQRAKHALLGAAVGAALTGTAVAVLVGKIRGLGECFPEEEECSAEAFRRRRLKDFGVGALIGIPLGASVGLVLSPRRWEMVYKRES